MALAVFAVSSAASARGAAGNGNHSHIWITQQAVDYLPEGALRDLLSDPEYQVMLLNGAMFPDGGYVIDDDYGEMAHWQPFQSAYRRWITRTFEKPYTYGEAAEHTAFLFGMASHGMGDQVYDSQFMEIARVYDADGWADGLLDSFDTATDVMLVADTMLLLDFEPWVPAETISQIFADDLGYTIDPGALHSGQDLLHRLVLSYVRDTGLNDPDRVAEYRAQYPWASANMMDPYVQGTPPCEALTVAAFWQSMWFLMHEEQGPDLIIATVPGAGGSGHPTDSSLVESQLIVAFGEGMDATTVNGSTVTVTDAGGNEHDVRMRFHYGDETNVLRIEPMADWAADTEYTVTLAPGIAASSGTELGAAFSYSFTTAASMADAVLPCTDSTPFAGEPDVGTPPDDQPSSSGGCAVAGGGGAGALLLVLVVFAVIRRRW